MMQWGPRTLVGWPSTVWGLCAGRAPHDDKEGSLHGLCGVCLGRLLPRAYAENSSACSALALCGRAWTAGEAANCAATAKLCCNMQAKCSAMLVLHELS